jgi:hypothetical protein
VPTPPALPLALAPWLEVSRVELQAVPLAQAET